MSRVRGGWRAALAVTVLALKLALGLALGLAVTSCSAPTAAPEASSQASSRPGGSGAGSSAGSTRGSSGLTTCALTMLPIQASQVVDDIHHGGPFDYPGNDGVTFANRERVLPAKTRGYYREYTVPTPGSRTRGARRIVTGGTPAADPPQYFYTADHYETFCQITGADR